MITLGLSAFYHDSAISIVRDGEILFAAQEERYSRKKHDERFPRLALQAGLKYLSLKPEDIDQVVFYEKPFLKFERILETSLAFAPRGFLMFSKAMPIWIKEKLFQKQILKKELLSCGFSDDFVQSKIYFSDHHLSHAASAYYPSPFDNALILTMDGVGEWATTTVYQAEGSQIRLRKQISFPHSLGLLYSTFTTYCGFKVNSGEYKLMGLAPYGKPRFADKIKEHLIEIKPDGSYQLNMKYFDYCVGLRMYSDRFDRLFEFSSRKPEEPLKPIHMDLAASVQLVLEEVILKICESLKSEFNADNLCLAGGVALNCVANSKILSAGLFKHIWIQPASGDAGGALGAALAYQYNTHEKLVKPSGDRMNASFLGDSFSDEAIEQALIKTGLKYKHFVNEDQLIDFLSEELANDKAYGIFQGRMEFGPRALGHRSIIASPLSSSMQKNLNLKIKFRESFRPFAPMVLKEQVDKWFDFSSDSPYMLLTAQVRKDRLENQDKLTNYSGLELLNLKRSQIPAVTHVDNSARLQTVCAHENLWSYKLLNAFLQKTGCPVLVNTSFNIRGEPIVGSPNDAIKCFLGTDLDGLAIGSFVVCKDEVPTELLVDYRNSFDLD